VTAPLYATHDVELLLTDSSPFGSLPNAISCGYKEHPPSQHLTIVSVQTTPTPNLLVNFSTHAMSANKDTTRVAAGLKAAIHNSNVSPEAKDQAAEKLQNLTGAGIATTTSTTEHENRVLGGFRAVLSNDNTSAEAKQHAREVLTAAGYQVEKPTGSTDEEHETRVMAGYKAALTNPNVSEGAKRHATEILKEYGAL